MVLKLLFSSLSTTYFGLHDDSVHEEMNLATNGMKNKDWQARLDDDDDDDDHDECYLHDALFGGHQLQNNDDEARDNAEGGKWWSWFFGKRPTDAARQAAREDDTGAQHSNSCTTEHWATES